MSGSQNTSSTNAEMHEPEANPVSVEGVDLTQIHALLALTPTQRVEKLVEIVNELERLRPHVKRL